MLEKSEIMCEFLKIAKEQNLLGKEAGVAPNPYQEDPKTIQEKRLKPSEKSVIEQAHPEPVFVAESLGEGGLVENEIENQKKMVEVINKTPSGTYVGHYASAIKTLVKFAEQCDSLGYTKASDLLTDAAKELLVDLQTESFFE